MISLFPTILTTPVKGWEGVKLLNSKRNVLLKYALPLILTASACSFANTYIISGELLWNTGFNRFMVMFTSLFLSIYLAAFTIRISYRTIFGGILDFSRALIFTIFSFSAVIAVIILDELIEDMFFISAFYLYTFYIVYEGGNIFLDLKGASSDKKIRFVIISSLAIILWPYFTKNLLFFSMPGLK